MKVKSAALAVFFLALVFRGGAEDFFFPFDTKESLDDWAFTPSDRWKWTDGKLHPLGVSGDYQPPHRSPQHRAAEESDFRGFHAHRQGKDAPDFARHRDMCVFFGWQNPANFYYVHLGEKVDPHSSQVFIVKNAPRTSITQENADGTPWKDDSWHEVKVVREVESGRIDVYFDDMTQPVKTAVDKNFTWGMVGLGSFDDLGQWDDVRISGTIVSGKDPVMPSEKKPVVRSRAEDPEWKHRLAISIR